MDRKSRQDTIHSDFSIFDDDVPEEYKKCKDKTTQYEKMSSRVRGNRQQFYVKNTNGKTAFSYISIIIILIIIAVGGYKVYQLQLALNEATAALSGVETAVSQTGQSLSIKDSEVQAELKVINSEIRKLWDVSNKRNRHAIEGLEKELKIYKKKLDKSEALLSEINRDVTQLNKNTSQLKTINAKLQSAEKQIKDISSEQTISNAAFRESIDGISKEVTRLKSLKTAVEQQLKEANDGINSMDSFRQQLNRRVLQLESSVRSAQKK